MRLRLLASATVIACIAASSAYAASIVGTNQSDVLRGTPRGDTLIGKAGADRLYGFGGNDRFTPGAGKDHVFCGAGVDRVQADRLDVVARDCEIVSRPAAPPRPRPPAPAPPPPPPPPPPIGTTRTNPVPFGTTHALGNGWTLKIESITPNANAAVAAENRFNDPPKPGYQFFIATVTVANVSSSETRFRDADLRSVGPANVPYTTFTNSCGVIPNSFLFSGSEAFPGGSITRNVCWEVPSSDADQLQLFWEPLISGSRIFFALR